jgi:hypothetical protein
VTLGRHTIQVSNLPPRIGIISLTTRSGVLAGTGGTAHATATGRYAGKRTSSVPATLLR